MNKIQNVLNDEESMKQIKELADMLTADNGGQGERGGKSEAPQSPPEHGLFSASPKPRRRFSSCGKQACASNTGRGS